MVILWMIVTLVLVFMVWRRSEGAAEQMQSEMTSLRTEIEELRTELKGSRAEKS
jgi:uncharacterized membrane-anchored protein YhcB (DUF1043 family)